jgi:AcrR family transcriptional regulator
MAIAQKRKTMTGIPNPERGAAVERILVSAAQLFARFGYNGVSTRDIASGAGVNEVTIYRHYPRKRDLYLAVLDAELQQVKLRGHLLAHIAEATTGRAALERAFELIAETLMQKPGLLRLLQFSTLELGEDIDPLLRKHLGQLVEVVAHYLEPWARSGEIRVANTKAVVLAQVAIVVSSCSLQRLFLNGAFCPDAMLKAYADLCAISTDRTIPASQFAHESVSKTATD